MIPAATKVYFAVRPAGLRKSFDGLAAMAISALGKTPTAGGLFVFLNRRADQVRVLFRDPHGWCILAKRLDAARFRRPRFDEAAACWETDAPTLMRFLEDLELARPKQPRAARAQAGAAAHLSVVQPQLQ